jgi:rubrerythrin
MELKGSQTEKNLLTAFAGESQARNRYTYFAKVARKEGYEQIAAIFEESAWNERAHAKREFSFLQGGEVEIRAAYPAGVIGDTEANLKASAEGEHFEWTQMYPDFEKVAREEGFGEIAGVFKEIGEVEEEECTVFKKTEVVRWKCRNCGYVHQGTEAPKKCPACAHPQSHFQILEENY